MPILRTDDSGDGCTKPFLGHLQDLRKTLIWALGFLGAGMVIAIFLARPVLAVLMQCMVRAGKDPADFIRVTTLAGGFFAGCRVILWTGIILSAPAIIWTICRFVFPGLTHREKQAVLRAAGFAALLFAAGIALGYFTTMPIAIDMMFTVNELLGVTCEWVELADYVSFVLRLLLAFGLAFELPVIVLALGSVGILKSDQLRAKRRHVIVGLMVLAMFLTPHDPFTMLLMALPLIGLHEFCIWVIWSKERKSPARASPATQEIKEKD